MHIMGALAEFERGLIVERNAGGLWLRGRSSSVEKSPRAVARTMRVGKSTLYRALKATDGRSGPTPPIPTGG